MNVKRILAMLLALCLTVSVPSGAWASELAEDPALDAGGEAEPAVIPGDITEEAPSEEPEDTDIPQEQPPQAANPGEAEASVTEETGKLLDGGDAGAGEPVLFAGTPGAPYTTWQNATVTTPDTSVEFMLDSYDNSFAASQVWLAVTVAHDNQAIRMDFSSVPKSMYAYVYSAETLQNSGPASSNYLMRFGNFSGSASYSCKVDYAGVYYIMLRPYNSSHTFDNINAKATFSLLDGDGNEDMAAGNNDVWSRATELTENVNSYFNFNGSNDVDWFKITTSYPGQAVKIVLSNFDYTVKQIRADLYTEAKAPSESGALTNKEYISSDCYFSYKINEPGTYYLRLKPQKNVEFFTRSLKVRYELVAPDGYELNDTWQAAAAIPQDGYEMPFTLNGENDEDWFWFETSEANEVVYFTIRGFETDYSNSLHFYVYDIDEATGSKTELHRTLYMDRNSEGKQTVQFETPGRHYARIDLDGAAPIENILYFKMEHRTVLIDNGEPNDTWQEATPIYANSPQTYNLPASTDVDWFCFTVNEPNQTVEFTFDVPAGGNVYAKLYSHDALEVSGNSASYMEDFFYNGYSGAGQKTKRWMLGDAGEYYLKMSPRSDSIFEADASISYSLIPPDETERNNGWKTATQINEGVAATFTLPASNDADWFKFDVPEPNQTVEFTLTVPAGGNVYANLYSGSEFKDHGDNADYMTYFFYNGYSGAGEKTMRWMLRGDEDTYYLWIKPRSDSVVDGDYTLTYRLIEPDRNERNNTWRSATPLNEGVASVFTFPASNDTDFFKLTTTEPDQTAAIRLTIPEGGNVYMTLYAGSDYALSGDNADYMTYFFHNGYSGSGVITRYYLLEEPGDYYLKLSPRTDSIFDEDATITYSLIGHDANENNNTWENATVLHAQANVSFTLPASNDEDWFKLDSVTPGDKITVYLNNLPKGSCQFYNSIRYKTEADVSPTHEDSKWCYLNSDRTSSYSRTYTVQADGEYYIRLSRGDAAVSLNTPMTFRYSIARDNIDIKSVGVSSIGNASTTIYQGKTLGLYAVINPANASNQNVTWTSSNPNVATVDADGLVTGIAPGTAQITVTTEQGGFTATSTITVAAPVPVSGVSVTSNEVGNPGSASTNPKILSLGTAIQLSYKTTPEGATNQDVSWTVSDPEVLSVTDYGKVAAIGSGSAYVTVTTADGNYTAHYYINVPDETSPIKRISLNMGAATLYMGEPGTQLTANIYPSNATNQQVIWSSDDPEVASVDQNGLVTARSVGYTTIRVAAQENGAIQAACTVSVQPVRIRVTGISFQSNTLELGLYGTGTLTPIVAPANATDQSVTWESNNKNIVSVSRGGVVTGLNIGTAIITATTVDGQKTASIAVRVSSNAPLGDLNNDGDVDSADALLILRSSVGLMALSEAQRAVADVNSDNSIDAGDAILILRYDAGLIDEFPGKKK